MTTLERWELEEAERTAHNEFLRKACALAREAHTARLRVETYRKRLSGQARNQSALRARVTELEAALEKISYCKNPEGTCPTCHRIAVNALHPETDTEGDGK